MALAELARPFDSAKAAQAVHRSVNQSLPVSPEEVKQVVLSLAEGARITKFIEPLAIKETHDLARLRRTTTSLNH